MVLVRSLSSCTDVCIFGVGLWLLSFEICSYGSSWLQKSARLLRKRNARYRTLFLKVLFLWHKVNHLACTSRICPGTDNYFLEMWILILVPVDLSLLWSWKMNLGVVKWLVFVVTEASAVDNHHASTPKFTPSFVLIIYQNHMSPVLVWAWNVSHHKFVQVNLFEDQIKASMGYGTIARMADLLMANLHVCEPGASSVTVSVTPFNMHLYHFLNISGNTPDPSWFWCQCGMNFASMLQLIQRKFLY